MIEKEEKEERKRTVEEITEFLTKVYDVWKKNPEIPFGELVLNPFEEGELYIIWDEEFLKRMETHYSV